MYDTTIKHTKRNSGKSTIENIVEITVNWKKQIFEI